MHLRPIRRPVAAPNGVGLRIASYFTRIDPVSLTDAPRTLVPPTISIIDSDLISFHAVHHWINYQRLSEVEFGI